MFEKEAKKHKEEFITAYISVGGGLKAADMIGIQKEQSYKEGAELGYTKANEWHYPSKGEYPKECENVLCYCKGTEIKFCSIGHTIIGGDNKIRWWSSNRSEELKVYAWKEIVLPKDIEEK